MNLGSLALNLLIIALFLAVVMGLARHRRGFRSFETWQLLFVGSLAAVIVVVTLLIARPTLPDEAVTRLAVVVAAEELSRLAGVIVAVRWQRRRDQAGAGLRGRPRDRSLQRHPASAREKTQSRPGDAAADGLMRGVLIGAGFVTIENLLYVLIAPPLLLARTITAGAVHLACGGLYGYATAQKDVRTQTGTNRRWRPAALLPAALALAMGGHLAYNLLARSLDQILILW